MYITSVPVNLCVVDISLFQFCNFKSEVNLLCVMEADISHNFTFSILQFHNFKSEFNLWKFQYQKVKSIVSVLEIDINRNFAI